MDDPEARTPTGELAFEAPPPAREPSGRASDPTFSIVVAAYQAAETIAEALESAFAQTHPPLEVVVCDDGSTDATLQELRPFESRIVLLRQPNRGEGAAKNAAIRAAHGEYVAILDADDVYLPRRLEALGALARARPDLDLLTTDAILEVAGEPVRRCYTDTWLFEADDQRRAILERNFVFGLAAVRRNRLLEIGGFDESLRHATDWDCWIRLILSGSQVGLVAEPLARYRLRSTSLSADRAALLEGRAAVLEHAAEDPMLTAAERSAVLVRVAANRRGADLARAVAALAADVPEARSLALRVARTQGVPVSTRVRAFVAAAAPRLGGSIIRRRMRTGREGPAGVLLPPDAAVTSPRRRGDPLQ